MLINVKDPTIVLLENNLYEKNVILKEMIVDPINNEIVLNFHLNL